MLTALSAILLSSLGGAGSSVNLPSGGFSALLVLLVVIGFAGFFLIMGLTSLLGGGGGMSASFKGGDSKSGEATSSTGNISGPVVNVGGLAGLNPMLLVALVGGGVLLFLLLNKKGRKR